MNLCSLMQDSISTISTVFSVASLPPVLRRRMLGMSVGIEELGAVRWDLALCLLSSWVFCYFSIWKGVRSSGKVRGEDCNGMSAARQDCLDLKSLLRFFLIFLEGGVLHRHIPLRDAADPAHPGTDPTWSCGRDLLLLVPKHQRPGGPGGILHVDSDKQKTAAGGGKKRELRSN